ncbi:MAG: hypothetical protein KDK40_05940, partial [Chlamydiia bacterium]|nr:hypothetical protein [Chlamydiia bacterium]
MNILDFIGITSAFTQINQTNSDDLSESCGYPTFVMATLMVGSLAHVWFSHKIHTDRINYEGEQDLLMLSNRLKERIEYYKEVFSED